MEHKKITDLLKATLPVKDIVIKGWVRTRRASKDFSFIEINDGSCLKNIQIIANNTLQNYSDIEKLTTGSSVIINGKLLGSPGSGQDREIHADAVDIINIAPDSYPLQKKRHSDEFLRTIAHLRPRTNKYGAVFRIRSELSYAIHTFFREKGFQYVHSPILTGSDCEGAGELFNVTAFNLDKIPQKENTIDYSSDFFGKEARLTVSGQLSAEMFSLALGNVYTFGPTFRAENSNTKRHAAEFWMVEPEMAFCDLKGAMDIAEEMLKYLVSYSLEKIRQDLDLFFNYVDKTLPSSLNTIVSSDFKRISYETALDILKSSGESFEHGIDFGLNLQTEHERYLTEKHFKKPVIVYDYPKKIKPFYMKVNEDDKTVSAMDVLVPRIGEIIGGSQREDRLDILEKRMDENGLNKKDYWWYLDSRKYGSVPHSGFGLGFERLIMMITGISNIRDVIPFPRTPNNLEF